MGFSIFQNNYLKIKWSYKKLYFMIRFIENISVEIFSPPHYGIKVGFMVILSHVYFWKGLVSGSLEIKFAICSSTHTLLGSPPDLVNIFFLLISQLGCIISILTENGVYIYKY